MCWMRGRGALQARTSIGAGSHMRPSLPLHQTPTNSPLDPRSEHPLRVKPRSTRRIKAVGSGPTARRTSIFGSPQVSKLPISDTAKRHTSAWPFMSTLSQNVSLVCWICVPRVSTWNCSRNFYCRLIESFAPPRYVS